MLRLATLTIVPQRVNKLTNINVALINFCPIIQTFSTSGRHPLSPRERIAGCACDQFGERYLILYTELTVFVFIWRGVIACRNNTRT